MIWLIWEKWHDFHFSVTLSVTPCHTKIPQNVPYVRENMFFNLNYNSRASLYFSRFTRLFFTVEHTGLEPVAFYTSSFYQTLYFQRFAGQVSHSLSHSTFASIVHNTISLFRKQEKSSHFYIGNNIPATMGEDKWRVCFIYGVGDCPY
jgi:hypothetical protein